jgi:dsDNA-specific endonuclease/ATPase MutS2
MNTIKMMTILTACIGIYGCSSTNKILDKKLAEEPAITRSALQTQANESVEADTRLSQEQKQKLTELRASLTSQIDEINQHSLKLRSILLKDLLAAKYNGDEVVLIKTRMKKLEAERLNVIFDAAEKTNLILGREAALNPKVMDEFLSLRAGDRY